jgi:organic hydroperoxide reductase OsmC/OhrA
VDEAFGVMERNPKGKLAISRITLRPRIEFTGERVPSTEDLESMHRSAHEECFIANSLKSEVVVEAG